MEKVINNGSILCRTALWSTQIEVVYGGDHVRYLNKKATKNEVHEFVREYLKPDVVERHVVGVCCNAEEVIAYLEEVLND